MRKVEDDKQLFSGFAEVPFDSWYKQAIKEAGQEQNLHSDTYEGIEVKPIYYQEDRSESFGIGNENGWLYIEEVEVLDETIANKDAIEALAGGADGILFILKKEGIDVNELLKDIWVDNCIICFKCLGRNTAWIKDFIEFYSNNFTRNENLNGWISLERQATGLPVDVYDAKERAHLKELHKVASEFPNFNLIEIGNHDLKNAGVDVINELTYTIARGVEVIETLRKAEFSKEKILRTVVFAITVSMNYFFEISKLRALRVLWTKIGEAYDVKIDPSEIKIHALTSSWSKSILDKENNIIRNAAEAMAAVLGGANFISIGNSFEESKKTHKRISRNISHILKEESFLNKVSDPGKGSYLIESTTSELVNRSWARFLEIESEGGYNKAIENGKLKELIQKQQSKSREDLDLRKRLVIGANIFPNLHEQVAQSNDLFGEVDFRATGEIEKLRRTVESTFNTKKAKRPIVMILTSDSHSEKSSMSLLKNVFTSIGFQVETKTRQMLSGDKEAFRKYTLSVWVLENEDVINDSGPDIKDISKIHPIIFTSDKNLKVSGITFYPIEKLALTDTLNQILTLIPKK